MEVETGEAQRLRVTGRDEETKERVDDATACTYRTIT